MIGTKITDSTTSKKTARSSGNCMGHKILIIICYYDEYIVSYTVDAKSEADISSCEVCYFSELNQNWNVSTSFNKALIYHT